MVPPVRRKWSLENPTLCDLIALCAKMRPDEIDQLKAMTGAEKFDFEAAAVGFYQTPGIKFLLVDVKGEPIVAGGFEQIQPAVWHSWMTGTMAAWETHWRSITEASRFVMECLFEDGARRIQTYALADRTEACRWYERGLKMRHEGTMQAWAHDGRDVAIYSRTIHHINEEKAHGRRLERRAA